MVADPSQLPVIFSLMATTLDDRVFETAVEQSPEDIASNAAYFKEKGYAVETEEVDAQGDKVAADKPTEEEPAAKSDAVPEVDGKPVEDDILAEYHADNEEKNDGEKLGRHARRTRELKELRAKVAEETAKREELEKLVAAKPAAEAKTSALQPPPVEAPIVPVQAKPAENPPADEIKPKEFEKPRPEKPTLQKFVDAGVEDPYGALATATTDYADALSDWKDEKRDHDSTQAKEIADRKREKEEQTSQQAEFLTVRSKRFEDVRKARPDFDKTTEKTLLNPVLTHLLVGYDTSRVEEVLPDGLDLAYQLSLPENAELFKELTEASATSKGEDARKIQAKIENARAELTSFRRDLKRKAAAEPVTTEKPAEKAPANEKPNATDPTPSNGQPRREEASPTTVKGRGVTAGKRIEDIDPEDYDARKAFRKQNGQA